MADVNKEYEIRLAKKEDIPMIMEYIDEDWRKGHILATNRELFEYELLEEDGTVNMALAINVSQNRIDGCLGFLKTARGTKSFDSWGVMWKAREGCGHLLGVKLAEYVKKIPGNRYYMGFGLNPKTAVKSHKIFLRHYVGKMKHWYYLAEKEAYTLAIVNHKEKRIHNRNECYQIALLDLQTFSNDFDKILITDEMVPNKNKQYYIHRFFCHPIYSYQIYGVYKESELTAFFVFREDTHNERVAIRIVDYYGEESHICAIENIIPDLFSRTEVEYVDFYTYGFSDKSLEEAGFSLLVENDTNVIPNYFGPFVQENIDIWVSSPVENTKFVKGDGDQDRPNKV